MQSIFYYDCDPASKKAFHPLHNRTFDQGKTDEYTWKQEFFSEPSSKHKVAVRKGHPLEGSCEYVLKREVSRDLVRGKRAIKTLHDDDFVLDVQQKGVDVRIGLDVALIAQQKFANQIVLIKGDGDFVPLAKFARCNGVDFILNPIRYPFKDDLGIHVDG